MSTATAAITTPPASTALRRPSITGHQTFLRAIAAEWIKIRSLRSTWITSAVAVMITVLFGAGLAIAMSRVEGYEDAASRAVTSGATFGQIAVAVLGALVITGEYASGQIRSSLAAVPRRSRLLAAKAIVVGVLAFVLGLVSIALSWAISAPFMNGHEGSLTDATYLGLFWGTGLTYALIALMSLGLGLLLRSTAGSITIMAVLLFVITLPLGLMSGRWEWAATLSELMPSSASEALSNPLLYGGPWIGDYVSQSAALAAFLAWALIPLVLGWIALSRRDA